MKEIKTIGALKQSGYQSKNIKAEMRNNLLNILAKGEQFFTGIEGYEHTVLPQLQAAILSKHNILFLGLRGQAKTRMARMMVQLLDEYIPAIAATELNDDPFNPISYDGKRLVRELGDETPIKWIHRSERYTEKLATPDVSVADLIGDIDPIKAAALKLSYTDERIIHYGLIPRSNRGLFVINELPDLQPRIQVSLFNMLQEGDFQIRGFKVQLPLDIQFVFTANPEDYTNRGNIITPLKDRIGSQILTHYPKSMEVAKKITEQEAKISEEQKSKVHVPDLIKHLLEQIAIEARSSEYVDQKSGVSARLTIAAYECLYSIAERRMLINKENNTTARITDLYATVQAINGKIELVYEGELEGLNAVAYSLIGKAIRQQFLTHFPNPEKYKKSKKPNPYQPIIDWFEAGNTVDFLMDSTQLDYEKNLAAINGLNEMTKEFIKVKGSANLIFQEFLLHGISEFSMLSKRSLEKQFTFKDMLSDMLNNRNTEED